MNRKIIAITIFQISIETLLDPQIIVLDDLLRVAESISNSKNLANSASPICSLIWLKNISVWFIAIAAAFKCRLACGLNKK